MGRFGAGQPMRRVEDQRFLTGAGRYTDDISLPRQAAAFVLRTPYAHARLLGIDTDEARRAPGVLGVFTAADLDADGVNTVPTSFRITNRDGTTMTPPPRPALARRKVVHVGEPVALVVAETLGQAQDAAEAVMVDYEPLEAVVGQGAALAPGAPVLWPEECPGNLCFDWEMGEAAAVERLFRSADRIVRLDLVNNRLEPVTMEPRAAIGDYDPAGGRFTLITGSQGSHSLQATLCDEVFRIPRQRMHVVSPDVGGGFGLRLFLFPEHVLVLWAARRLGRPVKWTGDRSEAFLSDHHGRDHASHAELALDGDGRCLALKVDTLANLGGYVSDMGAFIPTRAGAKMLAGVYTLEALHVRVRGVMTNTAPVDAYRGAGRPEAAYLVERMMDVAAREIGLAPDEIRRRNFIPPEAMPYRTAGGATYDSGDFQANMELAMARADWAGFAERRRAARERGLWRGIGMSSYVESCGGGGAEDAEITVDTDGRVTVLIGTQSSGQGHETAYAQMAADALGLPIETVRVVQGDTDIVKTGGGTGGSRSLPVGGAALAAAGDALLAKAKALAEHLLAAPEEALEVSAGSIAVAGANRFISWADLARAAQDPARLPAGMAPGLAAGGRFKPPSATYPNGCHICEVEIDPETGAVAVVGYAVVDDFGVVLNPLLLAGQIHGGVAQGIGQALFEGVVYDESGQLVTGTLMDYAIPHADQMPVIDFTTNDIPCRTNPLGVKGAGEAGAIGAPPAVINAVVDALGHLGIRHLDMPATPFSVWQAITRAREGTDAATEA